LGDNLGQDGGESVPARDSTRKEESRSQVEATTISQVTPPNVQTDGREEKTEGRKKIAEWMIAGSQICLLVINIFLWSSTKAANNIAKQSLQIAQRPYITVGRKDGAVAEFMDAQNKDTPPALAIYFQNSGHLPTSLCVFVEGSASPIFGGRILYGVKRMRQAGKDSSGFKQVLDPECPHVGGESTYIYTVPLPFNQEILDHIRNDAKSEVVLTAYPQYCDPFTGYVGGRITLKYFVEYKAFRILNEADITHMYQHVPDIRPSEYGPNELLAPCPRPSEEEEYQKRFLRHAGFREP
jgi:hypothetical protein